MIHTVFVTRDRRVLSTDPAQRQSDSNQDPGHHRESFLINQIHIALFCLPILPLVTSIDRDFDSTVCLFSKPVLVKSRSLHGFDSAKKKKKR